MPVSNLLIPRILHKIHLLNQYEEDDIDLIRYSLEAIMWEIEKTLIMFLVFCLMGYYNYFLVILIVSTSIRTIAGGYHSQTPLGCLLISFSGIFLSIMVFPQFELHRIMILGLAIFSLSVTILCAPMKSIERAHIQSNSNFIQKKILVSIITLGWLTFVFMNLHNPYAYPILWLIVLLNLQLLLEYIRRKGDSIC